MTSKAIYDLLFTKIRLVKLKIFVSGKEDELFNERVIANQLIHEISFEPIGSEVRNASDRSVQDEYLDEVNESQIYVVIFGTQYSKPSINEFQTARANQISTLIFVRQLRNNETRDSSLDELSTELKTPRQGFFIKNMMMFYFLKKKSRTQ